MFRTQFSLWDVAILSACLLLALLLILIPILRPTGDRLLITSPNGNTVCSLSEDQTFTVSGNGYQLTVTVENGEARVAHSDCPDGICRSHGGISKSGQSILCAPAGVRLLILGEEVDGSVDFVAG